MYRLIIRRDAKTPHCYRVEHCYEEEYPESRAVFVLTNVPYLCLMSTFAKHPGTICNPRKILADYQRARRGE